MLVTNVKRPNWPTPGVTPVRDSQCHVAKFEWRKTYIAVRFTFLCVQFAAFICMGTLVELRAAAR